jgi:glyoxylase-like metal-dependent hydrolase (beta-lactamase superfamily II)/rhodanese-related sulfurtransferase
MPQQAETRKRALAWKALTSQLTSKLLGVHYASCSLNRGAGMIFETIAMGGCRSYLVGCPNSFVGALIDPEVSQIDRYRGLAGKHGLRLSYVIDTHTHADHFSGTKKLGAALSVPIVMHRQAPAPFADMRLDEGDSLKVGELLLTALHTPGHTRDSMCLVASDRVFTGDTLLIGGTGRTDLPSGDPEQLYESLFDKLLKLDPALTVYPAHEYKGRDCTTIAAELESNPRLQKRDRAEFVAMMRALDLSMPTHLTEALRVNMSGGASVSEMLANAAAGVPFISLSELSAQIAARPNDLVILDVRERDAFAKDHIPGARHLPRGQLELRVNDEFPDPMMRIVSYCEFGKISTLAANTLRKMGFSRAVALDGGMKAWREQGFKVEQS